jgi:hypothetical protein
MKKLKPNEFVIDGYKITERPILFQTDMVEAILEGVTGKEVAHG